LQALQMLPIENDHLVKQIPAAGAYPAFRNAVGEHRQLHRMATLQIEASR
jgi:hypothetical protein